MREEGILGRSRHGGTAIGDSFAVFRVPRFARRVEGTVSRDAPALFQWTRNGGKRRVGAKSSRHWAAMRKVESASSRRIAWIASASFALWAGLAVLAAAPGCGWLRGLFTDGCHQIPSRCYFIDGRPIGLCVRCLWIYLGLAAGHQVFARFRVSEKAALRLLALAAGLMAADVLLEALGAYSDWRTARAATGGLSGFAVSWFTLRGLDELFGKRQARQARIMHEPG
jgi:uncharacterized membrane protein